MSCSRQLQKFPLASDNRSDPLRRRVRESRLRNPKSANWRDLIWKLQRKGKVTRPIMHMANVHQTWISLLASYSITKSQDSCVCERESVCVCEWVSVRSEMNIQIWGGSKSGAPQEKVKGTSKVSRSVQRWRGVPLCGTRAWSQTRRSHRRARSTRRTERTSPGGCRTAST